MHWRRKWQPTPVFLPGESQVCGAWWAAVYGVAQSRTQLKRLSSSSSWLEKQWSSLEGCKKSRLCSWKRAHTDWLTPSHSMEAEDWKLAGALDSWPGRHRVPPSPHRTRAAPVAPAPHPTQAETATANETACLERAGETLLPRSSCFPPLGPTSGWDNC